MAATLQNCLVLALGVGLTVWPGSANAGEWTTISPARSQYLVPDDENWWHNFAPPGADDDIKASTIYNGDLVVGGWFRHIGEVQANRVARWDGLMWHPLGDGVNDRVHDLIVYGDELIATGYFTEAGGVVASRIAAWDGEAWRALGAGLDHFGAALTVWNDELVVCGRFDTAGGVSAPRLAAWDGVTWRRVADGDIVGEGGRLAIPEALGVYQGDLIMGGNFAELGGVTSPYLARWDGIEWSAIGDEVLESVCFCLLVEGDDLYVGGSFERVGSLPSQGAARWDGAEWHALPFPEFAVAYDLVRHGSDLVVTGAFEVEGGEGIARWTGSSWELLGGGFDTFSGSGRAGRTLITYEGDLIVGGLLGYAGGKFASRIARWDGVEWHPFCGGYGLDDVAWTCVEHEGRLIVGGDNFDFAGCIGAANVAAWSGERWSPMGPGFTHDVFSERIMALAVYEEGLIAGGRFTEVGADAVNNVAQWDGETWQPLGSGTNGNVLELCVYDNQLVAGGSFTQAGGTSASYLGVWNGSSWNSVGGGVAGPYPFVSALAVFHDALVVGGYFTEAGGQPVGNVAAWSGSYWEPLGIGFDNPGFVLELLVHNGELYAGGDFQEADGQTVYGVARWNGQGWAALGVGTSYIVTDLTSYNGGLVVGGEFTLAGGIPVYGVARWNGSAWSGFGSGVAWPPSVWAVGSFDGSLYVLGDFSWAGPMSNTSIHIARWTDQPTPVDLLSFTAQRAGNAVILRWEEGERRASGGYHVYRGESRTRLTARPLRGSGRYEYVDRTAPAGPTPYWIHAIDGTLEGDWHGPVHVDAMTPAGTPPAPLRVHPNPTDGATTITYFATDAANVRLDIYDPQGRLVTHLVDGPQPAGAHAVFWDGQTEAGHRVAPGTYFAQLAMGAVTRNWRILIVR